MIKKYLFTTLLFFVFTLRIPERIYAQEATPEATLNNLSQLEAENTLQVIAETGNNTATSSAIQTGNATVSASLTTITNTNINGQNFQFTVDNSATSSSSLEIIANTGNNTATNSAEVTTGNLDINTTQTMLGNTNIEGSNWYFGIINLNGGEDYTLPNVWSYLDPNSISLTNSNNIETNNVALSNSQFFIDANTGNNQALNSTIDTGNINIRIQAKTELNETIMGDDWLLIKVNKFSPWSGSLKNWWGNTYEDENFFMAWVQLPVANIHQEEISVQNLAQHQTNVDIKANTGNNQANSQSLIETGSINVNANIFTKLNTTIKGSHWYYAIINIFGPWSGNLLFAESQPDTQPTPSQENIEEDQTSQISSPSFATETLLTIAPQPPVALILRVMGTTTYSNKITSNRRLLITQRTQTENTKNRKQPWLEMGTLGSLLMLGLSEKKRKKSVS